MKKFYYKFLTIYVLILSVILSACDNDNNSDGRHPIYIKAENFYTEGNTQEAYRYYEKYIQLRPNSAKASYKLALISQDKGDYVKAIYYYEKYLALEPDSSDKEVIQKWIEASKLSLVKEITKDTKPPIFQSVDSSIVVDSEIAELKQKNDELNRQLISLKESDISVDTSKGKGKLEESRVAPAKNDKIYIVQEGDNLYKISKNFYSSTKYYKQIIDANEDKLKGTSSIRAGDKLIIPQLKKTE